MAKFTALPTISVPSDKTITKPRPIGLLHLEDPASEIYIDYSQKRCRIVTQSDKLAYAEYVMQRDSTHELIVEDNDRHVVGVLNTGDVMGPKALTAANKQRVHHDDLLVKAVMTPVDKTPIIDAGILVHAKVGNIIATINDSKARFLLVAKESEGAYELCGLFSLIHISQVLHKDVAKAAGISDSILDLKDK
jgi:hypothetical protein